MAQQRGCVVPTFRVLMVCTANLCRSPYAAMRLQDELVRNGIRGVAVTSAGTRAQLGSLMPAKLLKIMARRGITADEHRSRPIDCDLIRSADVVLTAATVHRREVARLVPSARPKLFNLRQFARLLEHISPAVIDQLTVAELVQVCGGARGLGGPVADDEDIDDPWGRSRFAYHHMAREIDRALDVVAPAFAITVRSKSS